MKCWRVTFEVSCAHKLSVLVTDEDAEANAVRRATEEALALLAHRKLGRVLSVEAA